jgi:oligopeptide transport system ATP-binding protein
MEVCRRIDPASREVEPGRIVACHLYDDTNATTAGEPVA